MMGIAQFSMDDTYGAIAESIVPGNELLVAWLVSDISAKHQVCLDALAMLDDVSKGREPFEEWDSEGYEVKFEPSGLRLRCYWGDESTGSYSLEEARKGLEEYWLFLQSIPENPRAVRSFRPDLPTPTASLLMWERTWQRRHPYRG